MPPMPATHAASPAVAHAGDAGELGDDGQGAGQLAGAGDGVIDVETAAGAHAGRLLRVTALAWKAVSEIAENASRAAAAADASQPSGTYALANTLQPGWYQCSQGW